MEVVPVELPATQATPSVNQDPIFMVTEDRDERRKPGRDLQVLEALEAAKLGANRAGNVGVPQVPATKVRSLVREQGKGG